MYTFKLNDTLYVKGGNNAGYSQGKYKYTIEWSEDKKQIYYVVINRHPLINHSSKWAYRKQNDTLILGLSYVDGPNLHFVRHK